MRSSRWKKIVVFLLTFFSYAMFHVSRKSFSAIKSEMSKEEWMDSAFFPRTEQGKMYGLMDTLFMSFYGCGLYISGALGDRFDLRKLLGAGMIVTAMIMLLFGAAAFSGIHSLGVYAFLWALNGLIQSVGWPANVAVMGNWFEKRERGAVMGLWSANASAGNILGTAVVALMYIAIPDKTIAWKVAMTVVGVLLTLYGLLTLIFLKPEPHQRKYVGFSDGDGVDMNTLLESNQSKRKGISFWHAWLIPGVIPYALSYACLKAVNYAMFFWLPFYLKTHLNMDDSTADLYSMLYDVGQIIGGFLGGYLTDRTGMRSPIVFAMLASATGMLHLFKSASRSGITILLLSSGFLLGGPANLISTAISADLGTHESLRENTAALATVTGIIDGTGSVGAAVVQYLVGYLANCHPVHGVIECSWDKVFVLLEVGGFLSCTCLLPLMWKETSRFLRK